MKNYKIGSGKVSKRQVTQAYELIKDPERYWKARRLEEALQKIGLVVIILGVLLIIFTR